jgi:DNA-binding transcriptional LysR family regulator
LSATHFADFPEYHLGFTTLFAFLKRAPQIAEEHDSATSLIAAVEAGRGVALVLQGFDYLSGPRLKVRRLQPPPPPLVIGIAYRKEKNSPVTDNFVAAARRTKSTRVKRSITPQKSSREGLRHRLRQGQERRHEVTKESK